ncbi:MAG: hypothetical protein HYY18_23115 [Planctomycetes bacterium]|nr:hypothetical protein [Planctomycetota bacterium]
MGTLNFPCPSCGAMVSTVDLLPGQAPSCVGCGRSFPVPAQPRADTSRRGTIGNVAGGALLFIVIGVGFVGVMTGIRQGSRRKESEARAVEAAGVPRSLTGQESAALEVLVRQLEDPDYDRVTQAWHGIYAYDAIDHWGTFERLARALRESAAFNCLWILTGGMCEYYGDRGEEAVRTALIARKKDREAFQAILQSLEKFPEEMARVGGAAAGQQYVAKSLRILEGAQEEVDDPLSSPRLRTALKSLREKQLPSEQR